MEVTPGGFVVERGVVSAEAPMPGGPFLGAPIPTPGDEVPTVGTNLIEAASAESIEGVVEAPAEVITEDPISRTGTPAVGDEGPNVGTPLPPDQQGPVSSTVTVGATISDALTNTEAPSLGAEIPAKGTKSPIFGTEVHTVTLEAPASPPPILAADTSLSVPPYIGGPILRADIPTPGDEVPPVGTTSPPYILPPAEAYAGQELRMITVILRPGVDKVRDNLRLRQCYGILISYSGHDRFALQIFERTRGYRIEFPNYTTTFCAELVARLGSIVGADNVIVEPLRLH
jgi:hypothetical protein